MNDSNNPKGWSYLGASLLSGVVASAVWTIFDTISMNNSSDPAVRGISGLNYLMLPLRVLPVALLSAVVLAALHYGSKGRIKLRYGIVIAAIISLVGLQVWSILG